MNAHYYLLTHEHVTCTHSVEGDAPQLTPREARRKRDTQDNPAGAFVDPKPRSPGRDPVRAARRLWAALGRPDRP